MQLHDNFTTLHVAAAVGLPGVAALVELGSLLEPPLSSRSIFSSVSCALPEFESAASLLALLYDIPSNFPSKEPSHGEKRFLTST